MSNVAVCPCTGAGVPLLAVTEWITQVLSLGARARSSKRNRAIEATSDEHVAIRYDAR